MRDFTLQAYNHLLQSLQKLSYSFYTLENLDEETYQVNYLEKYEERLPEDVWIEKRNELNDLFNKSQCSYHLLEVLNKY